VTYTATDDSHRFGVAIARTDWDDTPLPAPRVVLWVELYGSPSQGHNLGMTPTTARQLAAELVRLADETEGR
jgi:hypothetical protein